MISLRTGALRRVTGNLGQLWDLIDVHDRRRLRLAIAGSGLLAVLDMIGVALILPLTLVLFSPDSSDDGFVAEIGQRIGIDSPTTAAGVLAGIVLTVFVVRGVLAVVLLRRTLRIVLGAEAVMAQRLLTAYLHAPLEYHVEHNSAQMQRTLGDSLRRIYQEAIATIIPAIGDALVVALVASVVAVFAPLEALVGGATMALIVMGYRRVTSVRAKAMSQEMLQRQQDSLQHIQQSLAAVREIRMSDSADLFADDLLRVRSDLAEQQGRVLLTEYIPRYLLEFGILLSGASVGAVAFLRYPTDRAAAVLALFIAAVVRVLPSLNRVLLASTRLSIALPNVATVKTTLTELEAFSTESTDREPLPPGSQFRAIQVRNVSYRYADATRPTISRVDLEFRSGDYLGIVGRSGAGKTTLLNLLLGLLDPTEGGISINGVPLENCRRSWHRLVGYVPQDVAFLDTTILENVALGAGATADVARVRQALEDAQMLQAVDALPLGLDTPVREAGARFSGGQRQRLGLARALYREPEVLVLDEATSALDPETEAGLLATLDRLRERTSIIVVAHRPSTIASCESVIRIEDGHVTKVDPVHGQALHGRPEPEPTAPRFGDDRVQLDPSTAEPISD